jgi:hypothetical protein
MESEGMLKPSTIEKLLNTKIIKENYPNLEYIKVFKTKKGYSIGAKYTSNDFIVTPKESEKLKTSIKEVLLLSSMDITFLNVYYYRIFSRELIEL